MDNKSMRQKPLRLWPGVAAAGLFLLVRLIIPVLAPDAEIFGVAIEMAGILAGILCGAVIILWWLLFSRAPWSERLEALALMAIALYATYFIVHPSIANGFMGLMLVIIGVPVVSVALVAWAVVSRRLSTGWRRVSMVASILLACGAFALIRTGGISGEGVSDLHWRWTPTAEERLLAAGDDTRAVPSAPVPKVAEPTAPNAIEPTPPSAPVAEKSPETLAPAPANAPTPAIEAEAKAEWPGFRGPSRDAIVRGVQIETDWARTPPMELWRKPIGPGWSSFAVNGDLVYTQEQRGDDEVVSCYRLSTGEPVWRHRDAIRFYESNGGPGPRGTPTIHNGRVYSMGATGLLNVLDAKTGNRVWSRNAATDTNVEVPGWGVASSPLVVGDVVVVAVSGQLVAYDVRNGDRRWLGPEGGSGYSSPHLVTIDGVPQILLLRGSRTVSVAPADGALLWEHTWQPGVGIVQPNVIANGDVLISAGDAMGGLGLRRLAIARGAGGWTVEERWTSRGLKPYFNDSVVHEGYAYGFDGSILSSIDLNDGNRKWKGGRYGHGQMILLPDQDLLLVLSEDGELALVSATPDKFTEVARVPALDGKTWNHPVLVGDVLLVRNGEEMAAFRLPHRAADSR